MTGTVQIAFNRAQLFALRSMLLDHMRDPEATDTWEDVISGEKTTLEEMFDLLVILPESAFQRDEHERQIHG